MGLFKSNEERRIERDIRIKQGIRRIEKAIREQAQFADDFVKNARRAREIGDEGQYRFLRNAVKKTATMRRVLERQLLSVKNALLVKRQAEASADFAGAMGLMAAEIGRLFGQTDLVRTQADWEKAMAQSQTMEERMAVFLETVEDVAAQDVEANTDITDAEIDRMIDAEAEAEHQKELGKLAGLRAELDALKGQSEKQK
jgi:hypothetical protein